MQVSDKLLARCKRFYERYYDQFESLQEIAQSEFLSVNTVRRNIYYYATLVGSERSRRGKPETMRLYNEMVKMKENHPKMQWNDIYIALGIRPSRGAGIRREVKKRGDA